MNRDLGIVVPPLFADEEPHPYAEKRRHPRRQLAVRCWICDGRNTVYVRLHDLSLGGLSVRAPMPFAHGSELELALVLQSTQPEHPNGIVSIRARGRVVWTRSDGIVRPAPVAIPQREAIAPSGPRLGATFLRFDEGEHVLRQLLERP